MSKLIVYIVGVIFFGVLIFGGAWLILAMGSLLLGEDPPSILRWIVYVGASALFLQASGNLAGEITRE